MSNLMSQKNIGLDNFTFPFYTLMHCWEICESKYLYREEYFLAAFPAAYWIPL